MSGSIPCPSCGSRTSDTRDSRPSGNHVRRRRECAKCGERYTTYEIVDREMKIAVAALQAMDRVKAEVVVLVKMKKQSGGAD